MRVLEILGDNRLDSWTKTRIACRGIVLQDQKILMSYETNTDTWMLPGGGMEGNETEQECCIRELAEETGYKVSAAQPLLEIDEYYDEWKWVNRYLFCQVTGNTQRELTEREIKAGMEPRWITVEEAVGIFRSYTDYEQTDFMKYGMYLRELSALNAVLLIGRNPYSDI